MLAAFAVVFKCLKNISTTTDSYCCTWMLLEACPAAGVEESFAAMEECLDPTLPLTMNVQFTTQLHRLDKLRLNYLEVPVPVVEQLGGTFNIRLLCRVNGAAPFHCGLVALGQGRGYITLSTKRMKEGGLQLGDRVEVQLEEDTSEFGMEVPEELAELLRQDEEGNQRFLQLPAGKQRYIIYYVAGVKSSQLRIERALLLINNLKRLPQGKEDFRAMLGKE